MGIGIFIFILGPIFGGVELAVTLFMTFVSLKPHEQIANAVKKIVS